MRSSSKQAADGKDIGRLAVTFGSGKVTLHRRSNGFVAVTWNEGGTCHRTTRADWDKAEAWAKAKARAIDAASGQRWVSPAAADRLAWLERICGGPEAVAEVLADLEKARKTLGPDRKLTEAAEWFVNHGPAAVREMTLAAAVAAFLEEYKGHHPSVTVRGVKAELNALARSLPPQTRLLDVSHEAISTAVRRGGVADRTIRNRLSYWVTFFNRAKALGWFPETRKSPAQVVKKPRVARKSPAIFTPEEGGRLLTAVAEQAPQHLPYLLIAGWLGCRPFECQRLLWDDFDFANGLLHVRAEVAGKTVSERWVPVPNRVAGLLEQCTKARRKASGKKDHACRLKSQNAVSFIARGMGLAWEIDILRHSRITYRLAETRDIGLVAEESGNSPSEIRASYKRPIPPGQWERWFAAVDSVTVRDWEPAGNRPWQAEEDALLGMVPDAEAARRLGRDVDAVLQRRLKRGIKAIPQARK